MEKKGNVQTFVIVMLTIAVVVMSVGFALADIELELTGKTTVGSSSWKVQFKEDTFKANSTTSEEAKNVNFNTTSITYDITLSEVGDVFDYNVVVENLGSFDAILKSITITDISSHSEYLSFAVNYNSKTYDKPSNDVLETDAEVLAAKTGTESINFKAVYKKPTDATKLPTADTTVSITVTLVYGEPDSE